MTKYRKGTDIRIDLIIPVTDRHMQETHRTGFVLVDEDGGEISMTATVVVTLERKDTRD